MKYYSELTKQLYENEEELKKAEEKQNELMLAKKQKDEERKNDYQKVKDAYAEAEAKYKEADKMLLEFFKKYGSIHGTADENKYVRAKDVAERQKDLVSLLTANFPFFFF